MKLGQICAEDAIITEKDEPNTKHAADILKSHQWWLSEGRGTKMKSHPSKWFTQLDFQLMKKRIEKRSSEDPKPQQRTRNEDKWDCPWEQTANTEQSHLSPHRAIMTGGRPDIHSRYARCLREMLQKSSCQVFRCELRASRCSFDLSPYARAATDIKKAVQSAPSQWEYIEPTECLSIKAELMSNDDKVRLS